MSEPAVADSIATPRFATGRSIVVVYVVSDPDSFIAGPT